MKLPILIAVTLIAFAALGAQALADDAPPPRPVPSGDRPPPAPTFAPIVVVGSPAGGAAWG